MALPDSIDTALIPNPVVSNSHSNPGLFYYGGAVYTVAMDAGYRLCVRKTTSPGGGTWSTLDDTNRPTNSASTSSYNGFRRPVISGDYLYMVTFVLHADTNGPLYEFHSFDLSTDSWATTNQTIVDMSAAKDPPTKSGCSIHVRNVASDELVVLLLGLPDKDMGNNYQRVDFFHKNKSEATTTWTGPVSIEASDAGLQEDIRTATTLAANNDEVAVVIQWGSSNQYVYTITSSNTVLDNSTTALSDYGGEFIPRSMQYSTTDYMYEIDDTGTDEGFLYRAYSTDRVSATTSSAYDSNLTDVFALEVDDTNDVIYLAGTTSSKGSGYLYSVVSTDNNGSTFTTEADDAIANIGGESGATLYDIMLYTDGSSNVKLGFLVRGITSGDFYYDEYTISAGATYTLTAAQGSFTLTGQASGLIEDLTLVAAQGAFVLTGQDAGIGRSFSMPADQGGFTLSGQNALFSRDYALTASQGSFALAGQNTSLLEALTIAAAQGSFTLSGQDVLFSLGLTMPAAQGSFTLSGQAAGLIEDLSIPLAAGVFTLSGQDTGLLESLTIAAGFGSFTLTGQGVNLQLGLTLTADYGSFVLSGQNTSLIEALIMPAAQGSFTVSGQAANLNLGLAMPAGQGSFTLSGQAVGLVEALILTADFGAFTQTGQASQLLRQHTLSAGQGSFALAGQNVTLTYTAGWADLVADQGAFIVTGQSSGLLEALALPAGQGSFSLAGQASGLTRSLAIPAGAGTFSLAGQDAGLFKSSLLQAAQGSFTLSGQATTLSLSGAPAATLTAGQGSFTVAGQAVDFDEHLVLVAEYGGITLTYQTVGAGLNRDTPLMRIDPRGTTYRSTTVRELVSRVEGRNTQPEIEYEFTGRTFTRR